MTIPLNMTINGPVPTSPDDLRTNLINGVAATNPGYTANLPGSLIEDVASTEVGGMAVLDQARIDALNDISPYAANAYRLAQQGAMLGILQGTPTNTSVYVVFSGPVGYVINPGFIVTDGTYQYIIQSGGIVETGGQSAPLYAVSTQSGSWDVPANTVTTLSTTVPTGVTLTVTNPSAGTPGQAAESVESYRSRVLSRLSTPSQGVPTYIKSLIQTVPGVIPRLVAVRQVSGGWEVIVGGGDPYAIGYAIYRGVLELSTLKQSAVTSRNVVASIIDGNDSYSVPFVNPPQQTVIVTTTWNTNLSGFTSGSQVNSLGSAAIQSYVNAIGVGQPINLLEMTSQFQNAVASVISAANLTTLTFSVSINGTVTPPAAGTSAVYGDPESYFYCSASNAPVSQG